MRQSAPARYAVKRTWQKIGKFYGHWFRPAPVIWANLAPAAKFRPSVFFSFGPCTARFLFFCAQKKENGGCICPAIIMAEIPPARRAGKDQNHTPSCERR